MQNVHLQKSTFTLLFFALVLAQQVSYGQSRQRWSFGPRVGVNLTNFVGNDIKNATQNNPNANKMLPGLSAGVGFLYSDISRFGFGVDLLYSQRGNKIETSGVSNLTRINYLELPLTARYFLTAGGKFRPNIYLGAVPALRLNAVNKLNLGGSESKIDVTDSYRSADLGLTGGIQLNFSTGDRQHFTIDARYTQGITNIVTNSTDIRNQMITLGLGYNFGIGREYQPGDRKLPIR